MFAHRRPATLRAGYAILFGTLLAPVGFAQDSPLYKNPNASPEQRVRDLVSRMTLEEKVSQLMNDAPAIDRLGIPAYNWWNECLHGVARAGRATVFPQPIGLAATWDTDLILRVASAISDEARAKHNEFVRRGKRNIYQGLTFWTPNINLFRDPRWGRGMETYGEDPYLTGRMAVAFIHGLQGDDPKYLKTVATAKHYAVHSGPEPLRHTFDAVVSGRDLEETYLPHFEAAIHDGGAYSVMCAYNSVDGQPACANSRLLEEILRKQWGFSGYVVSDCGAVGDIYLNHKFAASPEQGVADAIKAGTDLNCGVEYQHLLGAVHQGLVAESAIDQAVGRLFTARFRLGMFDPPELVKYAQIPYSENDSPAHRQLSLETARKSIVLLKNDNATLPLSKSLKTIAVIGPNADDVGVLLGNYNGVPSVPVTPLEGIRQKLPSARVLYARGSELAPNMPAFEVVPATALFLTDSPDSRNGLQGEYFNTSNFDGRLHRARELTVPSSGQLVGTVPSQPKPLLTRVDSQIDFEWWDGSPRRDLNDDDFGVRWTGYLSAPLTGTYQLGAKGINAFELYLDGKEITQSNSIHGSAYRWAPVTLEAGRRYALRLDFHEYVGDANIQLVWSRPDAVDPAQALAMAKQADAIVMFLGLSPRLEGEEMNVAVEGFQGGDRIDLGIPRTQLDLLKNVAAIGKPVVLVLLNGSALAVEWARDHVPAIVEAWYPGQAGGAAIADVLFGDYNPAGRLPVTFYRSADELPPFNDYSMKGRTYRFFHGEPLFPFGHGLSYTSFAYRNLNVPKNVRPGQDAEVKVEVENSGKRAGEEVVELYLKRSSASQNDPIRALAAFQRVALNPGQRKTVSLKVPAKQFTTWDSAGNSQILPGDWEIAVGGKQPGFQGAIDASTTAVVTGTIRLQPTP
jgi:beta-glucosidase